MEPAGIKYTKDITGCNRFVRIDLEKYGENRLIEDFLDMLDIEARKGEPVYPFEEVMRNEFKRRGLEYNV